MRSPASTGTSGRAAATNRGGVRASQGQFRSNGKRNFQRRAEQRPRVTAMYEKKSLRQRGGDHRSFKKRDPALPVAGERGGRREAVPEGEEVVMKK